MSNAKWYLTKEQFERLVSYANNDRDRVLLTFLFYTGRRVSEVIRCLTPNDFNFNDNLVKFTILKRKVKGRPFIEWLNVNSKVMKMMKNYIEEANKYPGEWIFPIGRFRVNQIIKMMAKKADMEYIGGRRIGVHILRHGFAVMGAKKIKNIYELKKLQRLLGHSSLEMTSWYMDHFSETGMKEFVEDLDG